jgi:hypothetical protein
MIEGNLVYQNCLYGAIRTELKTVMQSDEQVEEMLSQLRLGVDSVIKAQYELENANKLCAPDCGTMWLVTPAASGHAILEGFLESIEETKKNHE